MVFSFQFYYITHIVIFNGNMKFASQEESVLGGSELEL
jgi:hypothetical protein